MIYRTAKEVYWDSKKHSLHSPKPREWTYAKWFEHIIDVVKSEGSCKLHLTSKTNWINVPFEIKKEIIQVEKRKNKK